jgi:glycosyltransferase involved in cell wall biosynthesis
VRLAGFQADPKPYYEAMDVFALSSLREGLPNVLLEAMALAVPCVATRIAGVPRVVEDGVSGKLVEPGDVEALTAALAALLGDAELRRRFASAGRRTVEDRYSFARRMERLAALYDGMLGIV